MQTSMQHVIGVFLNANPYRWSMPTDTQLDEIAVIDLAPLANGSMRGKWQVGEALRKTLEQVGFFIVISGGFHFFRVRTYAIF